MQEHYYKFWRDLIKPKSFEVDKDTFKDDYGRFTIRPLEKGFGVTIGNSLRRILLSSMMGASVTAVRFEGVLHEFSSLPDVLEDVADIILNLKELRFKMFTSENLTLRISKKGPGKIKASDIQVNDKIEILNLNTHIATVGPNGDFNMDIIVGFGRGYVSSDMKQDSFPLGFIAIDSLFSPIKKVNYSVLSARVGQRTDYDNLVLEVWTDGSIKPDEALSLASKIMKDQLQVFLLFDEAFEPKEDKADGFSPQLNDNLFRSVDDLELSVRSANCLKNANIRFIGELVVRSEAEMLKTKNFGRKSLNEIKEILSEMGLGLGMKIDGWPPVGWDPSIANFKREQQ